ncbi:HPr family phosphocarrier protein [Rhodospirillaceae bacterium KN72]|uniref:HPr family phosphocarrier protein n=1 Tax=Pacificispira spongiicola TaxID=2729598 RepID=A0A7Y0E220_9PROT|nr:HPr family phosphocarrier protein [Pacificispira spongiicola]NMM45805.1 HPr family phosphocarrier protein [Pacificispira spongiicola]
MSVRTLTICNMRGLHARAAAKFVQTAEKFDAHVEVSRDGQTVTGTSIMGLMMLAAAKGTTIDVSASGPDADAALSEITDLVEAGFHEEE